MDTIIALNKEEKIVIHELLGSGDSARVETMLALYGELFPNYKHYIPRMRRRSTMNTNARTGSIAHYWLIEVDNKPIGITSFRYIHARNCGLGISFAILPEARSITTEGKRLSAFTISKIMDQLLTDANHMGSSSFMGMVTEVEHVELMNHYKRMGMLELPIKYYEPVFPPEANGQTRDGELKLLNFLPTILGFTPNHTSNQAYFNRTVLKDFALAFLVDHYGLPEDHLKVQSIIQSIPKES
jgi:hypothetical protein